MKNPTIQDIAHEANVSKSTVSRVLNGTARVHPDKEKAVLEASERLGFRPNFVAQSLAKGRSMTVGVLTQNIGSPFYDSIAQGVIAGLSQTGYSPIFVDGQWSREKEIDGIQTLVGRRPDGILLIGGELSAAEIISLCQELPAIVVARELHSDDLSDIHVDNVEGGYLATQHLIENGHERIVFIKGLEHHQDSADRLTGYKSALRDAKLSIVDELILAGDFTAGQAERAVNELVASGNRFTAIFAANDISAYGARLALHRRSIGVPDDVSIVGFDDQMESAYVTPPLTSVRQPAKEMGIAASKSLLEMIEGVPTSSVTFHGTLTIRESVLKIG